MISFIDDLPSIVRCSHVIRGYHLEEEDEEEEEEEEEEEDRLVTVLREWIGGSFERVYPCYASWSRGGRSLLSRFEAAITWMNVIKIKQIRMEGLEENVWGYDV